MGTNGGVRVNELQDIMLEAAAERLGQWEATEGRFNVLIAGNTGAGKSTLVNAFFGAELAEVGTGSSVTQQLQAHSVPGRPVTIYDTRGFEAGTGDAVKICEDAITKLRGAEREEDQLHVAWLCVDQGTGRFETAHEQFVRFLADQGIPAVIVVTRSLNDPGEFEKRIAAAIPRAVPIVNVIAKDMPTRGGTIPQEGLDDLLEATLRLVPLGRKSAVVAAQAVSWKHKDAGAAAAIRKAAVLAGGTAISPVPGSQLVGLAAIQGKLMMDLDVIAGATTSSVMHYAKLAALAAARSGGTKLFQLGLAQALKLLPALGTAAGTALGMGVAASVTGALGRAYWEATKLSVKSGKTVDEETFGEVYERERSRPEPAPEPADVAA